MKEKNIVKYILGSFILFVIASIVIPQLLTWITNVTYKNSIKKKNAARNEEDWGPEIVKKSSLERNDN